MSLSKLAGFAFLGPPLCVPMVVTTRPEQLREAAVGVSELEICELARHTNVVNGVAVAAGLVCGRLPTPHGPDWI